MITNTAAYQFVTILDPQQLADSVLAHAEQQALKGSVLVAEEGINLFLAGEAEQIDAFYAWLQADPRFAQMRIKFSLSVQRPFARLKVKVKPEIISFRRDDASPLQGRALAVTPAVLREWMRNGQDDRGRPLVLLDTRNAQEVAHGTFLGALTLPIDKFTELPGALEPHRAALADATVVSFCTGGIRCEKAALWMQADGMDNVLQLEGGILGYFEEVGGEGYDGRCFVFDQRVALDPDLRPLMGAERAVETGKI
ncbi:sulfurtransferase [Xanthomonas fragariae]|uniref:tRNA uridine(34) hydroxylase n=1 Tax=Xanthomonas fragariae TaxID=48664 RepID=A0A1Y6GVH4_9XANT|nr:sulfurtransferase [Xanthomonas fragariae]AOD14975.1 sulfurtransferase [Xanthomonas fragariae]AOD18374.1 sulfurtransferase [Xanthomonas fragariae]ENZ95867.1 rhodanese superfamily protein [Xanthomonas fragariae LMG 25863]MBL9195611.1 sulfurtransferase [Xanthomonas fragariae]MBL9220891.1 sulfurtransferase [Xanthomonas fragariae]